MTHPYEAEDLANRMAHWPDWETRYGRTGEGRSIKVPSKSKSEPVAAESRKDDSARVGLGGKLKTPRCPLCTRPMMGKLHLCPLPDGTKAPRPSRAKAPAERIRKAAPRRDEALRLRIAGMSGKQIAEAMGLTVASVKGYLQMSRRKVAA